MYPHPQYATLHAVIPLAMTAEKKAFNPRQPPDYSEDEIDGWGPLIGLVP